MLPMKYQINDNISQIKQYHEQSEVAVFKNEQWYDTDIQINSRSRTYFIISLKV